MNCKDRLMNKITKLLLLSALTATTLVTSVQAQVIERRMHHWQPVEVCPPAEQDYCPPVPGDYCPPSMLPGMELGPTQGDLYPEKLIDPNQFLPTQPVPEFPSPAVGNNIGAVAAAQANQQNDTFAARSNFAGETSGVGVRDMTIGDFFGASSFLSGPSYGPVLATSPIMGGDRRFKVSDFLSPLPSNRVYFSYHNFGKAVTDINGNQLDVTRYTFGFERMYLNDNASIEVRLPIAAGLDSQQRQSNLVNSGTQLGNLSLTSKYLLMRNETCSFSTGIGSILPTAEDAEIFFGSASSPSVVIKNNAYHIIPYFALHFTPNQRTWTTLSSQTDFAVRGNRVDSAGGPSQKYNEQNLTALDLSMGRWFLQSDAVSNALIRGVAGIFELHYTTTINDSDSVQAGGPSDVLNNPFNRLDVLNATVGMRVQVGRKGFATFGYVAPLRSAEESPFNGEFNMNFTRTY
jgi:hypothetical protein